jgi:hypothetical protein
MKNKSLKLRLSYFFRKRIHGKDSSDNMPELVKPESEGERTKSVIEDILRWADDGGQISQPNSQGKPGYSSGTGKGMMR